MRHSKGHYSKEVVHRNSKLVGSLSRTIDKIYCTNICKNFEGSKKSGQKSFHEDVKHFIRNFAKYKLFHYVPNRHHPSFPKFEYDIKFSDTGRFKGKMRRYSKKLQTFHNIVEHQS